MAAVGLERVHVPHVSTKLQHGRHVMRASRTGGEAGACQEARAQQHLRSVHNLPREQSPVRRGAPVFEVCVTKLQRHLRRLAQAIKGR